jgi:hypothetical protein
MNPFRLAVCRSLTVFLATWACASAITAQDELSDEPFTVFVAHEKAFARSGPSGEYYRTDALRHGQQLEVYLETDDGWLGVRPPSSSFCWIPASTVELSKSADTATVIEDRTVSWIGTHLGRARQYRWQVQLAEGEQVSILGRSERDGPDGPQTWFRIVPPSGEFRWVHRDQIVESAEQLVAHLSEQPEVSEDGLLDVAASPLRSKQATAEQPENGLDAILQTASSLKNRLTGSNAPAVESSRRRPEGNRRPALALTPLATDESPRLQPAPQQAAPQQTAPAPINNIVGSGVREAPNPREIAQAGGDQPAHSVADASTVAAAEFVSRPRLTEIGAASPPPQSNLAAGDGNWVMGTNRSATGRLPASGGNQVQVAGYNRPESGGASAARTISADSIAQVEREVRDATVEQLQLLFSRLMARGASAAEVEPVVIRARDLSLKPLDQLNTGRARLLVERAQQYQGVARRRDGNTVIRESGIPVFPAGSRPDGGGAVSAISAPDKSAQYETGYLVQVYSARPNSPPYALTDDAGNTIAYVTPQPGLNLRNHLNSHVRVSGQRGFLQGLNTPHIVVSEAGRTRR